MMTKETSKMIEKYWMWLLLNSGASLTMATCQVRHANQTNVKMSATLYS